MYNHTALQLQGNKVSIRQHLIYWILPLTVNLLFIGMYFFGTPAMESFVSPQLHHEYGALEMISLLILIAAGIVAIKSLDRNDSWLLQTARLSCIAFAAFVFLEEQDYGMNYIDFFNHEAGRVPDSPRTFHNSSYYAPILKTTLYSGVVLLCGILPFFVKYLPKQIAEIIPSKMMVTTIICLFIIPQIAFNLNYQFHFTGNKSLDNNISEFDESVLYYLFFVYTLELNPVFKSYFKARMKVIVDESSPGVLTKAK